MRSLRNNTLLVLGLIISVFIVYYPVLSHGFLYQWDDYWQILNTYTYNGITPDNLNHIFSDFYMGQYSPLNQFFYTVTYELFGSLPFPFHLINLCWHIGFVLLVFVFVKKILLLCKVADQSFTMWVAFIVALLTGIHPVQTEPVAWLSASKIVLQGFFIMGGLVCYLIFLQKSQNRYYLLTLGSYLLAFLCKEQAVVFPVSLLVIDYAVGRNLKSKRVWMEKAPFFMLSLFFGLVTLLSFSQAARNTMNGAETYSIAHRFLFMGYSLTEYITKLVLPIKLMFIYPFPIQYDEAIPLSFYIYPLSLLGLAILLWKGRQKRILIFGSLFFISQLLLMLHIIPIPRPTITADRYLYSACIGFFLIVVYYLLQWGRTLSKTGRTILAGLSVAIIVALGAYSNYYCRRWANDAILKEKLRELIEQRTTNKNEY